MTASVIENIIIFRIFGFFSKIFLFRPIKILLAQTTFYFAQATFYFVQTTSCFTQTLPYSAQTPSDFSKQYPTSKMSSLSYQCPRSSKNNVHLCPNFVLLRQSNCPRAKKYNLNNGLLHPNNFLLRQSNVLLHPSTVLVRPNNFLLQPNKVSLVTKTFKFRP